jgi:hypothetical protein
MMYEEYPATYTDEHGVEQTVIRNDGKALLMTLRGVEFTSKWLDEFEPTIAVDDPRLAAFPLNRWRGCTQWGPNTGRQRAELGSCRIEFVMPVAVVSPEKNLQGQLTVQLTFSAWADPAAMGAEWAERKQLHLVLSVGDRAYPGRGMGDFESEMLVIQRELPEGWYVKACINCAFSDYSVYGSGMFGCIICYRCCKSEYLKVRDKDEYMEIMYRYVDQVDRVQETYLCPEFERRVPGTGYRG